MPMLILFNSIILIFLFTKQLESLFFPFIILFSLIFLFAFKFNSNKNNFINFDAQINKSADW